VLEPAACGQIPRINSLPPVRVVPARAAHPDSLHAVTPSNRFTRELCADARTSARADNVLKALGFQAYVSFKTPVR
jgi:hypothetical protein